MSSKATLIDTGPLAAIFNERDQYHDTCLAASKELRGPFCTCWPVITEAAYLLRRVPGGIAELLTRIRLGELLVLPLSRADADGLSAIMTRYSDQGFDLADACLMHLAEREGIHTVFTIDRRHFSVFRTSKGSSALSLFPDLL